MSETQHHLLSEPVEKAGQPVAEVLGLSKQFGRIQAVDNVSFRFNCGEVHGFIGPNGAGKTTTMRILATIDHPDEGDAAVAGVSVVQYPDKVRPLIGFMPDYLDSYDDLNVAEYLDFYARAYRLNGTERRRRLSEIIEFTGLETLLDRRVEALSKGMKQRLSLARTLVNDPKVLILDEPAAGLDPRARVELRRLIRALADSGKAVLISSHILAELSEICDAVTIIEKGRIRASDQLSNIRRCMAEGTTVRITLVKPTDENHRKLLVLLSETPDVIRHAETPAGADFACRGDASVRARALRRIIEAGLEVSDFHVTEDDLEDAFLALTEGEVS